MKRKDFVALAAAMIAAKKLGRVRGSLQEEVKLKGRDGQERDVTVMKDESWGVLEDATAAAFALVTCLSERWDEESAGEGLLKQRDGEPFFDDCPDTA